MTNLEILLSALRSLGRADALALRGNAAGMDGTAIIAEEAKVPAWDGGKDYSGWPLGGPVEDEGQVWTLLQPHNAAHYAGRPSALRALWGLCHTRDPAQAKPFVAPLGTSGMYMAGECCTDPDAADPSAVYRSKVDNNAYSPGDYPQNWELVNP